MKTFALFKSLVRRESVAKSDVKAESHEHNEVFANEEKRLSPIAASAKKSVSVV